MVGSLQGVAAIAVKLARALRHCQPKVVLGGSNTVIGQNDDYSARNPTFPQLSPCDCDHFSPLCTSALNFYTSYNLTYIERDCISTSELSLRI